MRLLEFLDSRLGLSEILAKFGTGKHPPSGTSWLHTLGFAALTIFALQAITGVALSFHYSASMAHAYDSIRVMERDVQGGALVRALHHWGASAMVVLVFLHSVRVFFQAAYKKPRELTWIIGLGLFGLVVALGFTGSLLPWDQKAYFATKVGVNIAAKTPLIGETIKDMLYGAKEIGPTTIGRFFALHAIVLPALLAMGLGLHLYLVGRHGVSPVGCRVGDEGAPGPAYHPHHSFKEALVALLAVLVVLYLALAHGAPLEAVADRAESAYDPRPDWYLLAPFQLLKYFKEDWEQVGAFWLPTLFGLCLLALPFVDRNPERRLSKRPIAMSLGLITVIGICALTCLGTVGEPTHYQTPPHPLGASPELRQGYDLVRRNACFGCHSLTIDEQTVFGRTRHEAPDIMDFEPDRVAIEDKLYDPESDVMPSFKHLKDSERHAMAGYLLHLLEER